MRRVSPRHLFMHRRVQRSRLGWAVPLVALLATSACQSGPEWRRRAQILLRDPRFPRPPDAQAAPRCLDDATLAAGLRAAVAHVGFAEVFDLGRLYGAGCGVRAQPGCEIGRGRVGSEQFPQIDLSLIAFNRAGCPQPVAKASVVFDRRHPQGHVAAIDPQSLQITNIRFQKWDEARWNGGRWQRTSDPAATSPGDAAATPLSEAARAQLVPGSEQPWDAPFADEQRLGPAVDTPRSDATIDFMSPWPASAFKLLVASYVLQVLRRGQAEDGSAIDLQTPIPLPDHALVPACPVEARALTLHQALATMLKWSGNCATAALLRFLHAHGEIVQSPDVDAHGFPRAPALRNPLNDLFAGLGLATLQLNRSIARSGRWGNGDDNYDQRTASVANTHMTSWDAARLLWLFADLPPAQQPRWQVTPTRAVDASAFDPTQKALLREILADAYSGSALVSNRTCPDGAPRSQTQPPIEPPPQPGIPARLAATWLWGSRLRSPLGDHPYPRVVDDVHPGSDQSPYSADLSRCQARAEVIYLNKAGLTNVAHSSVGIVRGLSATETGDASRSFQRHYIVSFFSTLGKRYTDAERVAGLAQEEATPGPPSAERPPRIAVTQTVPRLGAVLDAWLALWLE